MKTTHLLAAALAFAACSREPAAVAPRAAVLLAAGDIAECPRQGDEATAALLDTLPGAVAVLGDNAYERGTAEEYARCYDPNWGRHKARTRPTPGNHEYATPNAAPYYAYFGAAAGNPSEGWYSYELGAWHVVVLNSEAPRTPDSPQIRWLRPTWRRTRRAVPWRTGTGRASARARTAPTRRCSPFGTRSTRRARTWCSPATITSTSASRP
jgi:hypothetical protein